MFLYFAFFLNIKIYTKYKNKIETKLRIYTSRVCHSIENIKQKSPTSIQLTYNKINK